MTRSGGDTARAHLYLGIAVILAEMEGTRREQMTSVLILGAVLLQKVLDRTRDE